MPPVVDEQFGQFLFDYQWQLLRRHAQDNDDSLVMRRSLLLKQLMYGQQDTGLSSRKRTTLRCSRRAPAISRPLDSVGEILYDWQAMREDGYGWWLRRLEHELSRVDLLRIDHFEG